MSLQIDYDTLHLHEAVTIYLTRSMLLLGDMTRMEPARRWRKQPCVRIAPYAYSEHFV